MIAQKRTKVTWRKKTHALAETTFSWQKVNSTKKRDAITICKEIEIEADIDLPYICRFLMIV